MPDRSPQFDDQAPQPTRPGRLMIISGPSGVGKSTITNLVRDRLHAKLSVSMTTRPKAEADVEGEHYFFVDRNTFEREVRAGNLLEWAEVYDNYYGTPRPYVESELAAGHTLILEIDIEGARQVKSKLPQAKAIYILPPDEDALLDRLRRRKRDSEEVIQRRFARARHEIELAKSDATYDVFLVNQDLDESVQRVVETAEKIGPAGD